MAFSIEQYSIIGVADAKLLTDNGTGITETDLLFVRNVSFEPRIQTISFEGDDTSEDRDSMTGINVTVQCDKFDLKAISTMYGKNTITTIPSVAWRLYFGDAAEVNGVDVGLSFTVTAKREDSAGASATELLKFVFPVTTMKVFKPVSLQYNSKAGLELAFSAKKTTTDVAGTALTSVPSTGAFWYMEKAA